MTAIHLIEGKILLSEEQETDIVRALAAAACEPAWKAMSKRERWARLFAVERAVAKAVLILKERERRFEVNREGNRFAPRPNCIPAILERGAGGG